MNLPVRAPAWGGGGLVVPPEFSGVTALGRAEQVYGPKEGGSFAAIVVLCLGAAFLALGIALVIFGPLGAAIGPGFIGVFLWSIGVWNVMRLRGGARVVVTYPMGFAAKVGSTVGVWPWAEIAYTLTKDRMRTGKRSIYHERRVDVGKENGEVVVMLGEHFDDVRALVALIKSKTAEKLLPPLQQAYDSGQAVTFGPVTVSKEAIESGGRRLAWTEVANVSVKNGRLLATPKSGKPLKVRTSNIPNVELLGVLIGLGPSKMDLEYY
jgi:hypothetical protein